LSQIIDDTSVWAASSLPQLHPKLHIANKNWTELMITRFVRLLVPGASLELMVVVFATYWAS
jgi:hypothetical protein